MFQHITVLVSFICAFALTYVFSRGRVHFSALLAVSMLNAALGVIINWRGLGEMESVRHWSLGEVLLQLGWVVPQYFSCSLVAMSCAETRRLDMVAFLERQRRVIFSATLALAAMGALEIYADRDNIAGRGPDDWIGAGLLQLLLGFCALLAGWAKARWLQWAGVGGLFVQSIGILFPTRSASSNTP